MAHQSSSTFSSLLRSQAYDRFTEYKAHECKVLEVYSFKDITTTPKNPVVIPAIDLNDWLHAQGSFALPDHGPQNPFLGGLRLLVQEWSNDDYASRQVVPFEDQATFQNVIDVLNISPNYPYLFRHCEYIAPRFVTTGDAATGAAVTTTIFQGPPFADSFTTLALSYNSQTRITSGFLGYIKSDNVELMPTILASMADARHPLILPLLCFNNFVRTLRRETRWQSQERATIAKLINRASKASHLDSVDFPAIHQRLIGSHVVLTSALSQFIETSSARLSSELAGMAKMLSAESISDDDLTAITADLARCLQVIDIKASDLISLRGRINTRIDMLQKVLYNHMQQRDSEISRDLAKQSTRMAIESTAIAEATRRGQLFDESHRFSNHGFLPGTAVSTMFSMSVFFAAADNAQVRVSSSFWMYWAITVPLTLAVLGTWALWLHLDYVKNVCKQAWENEGLRKTRVIESANSSTQSVSANSRDGSVTSSWT